MLGKMGMGGRNAFFVGVAHEFDDNDVYVDPLTYFSLSVFS